MFIIETELNLSIFILALRYFLSLRIAEKLHSHSAEVIGNMHAVFNRTNKLGNLSSSHFLIAFANLSGWSLEATTNHLHYQSRSSWSATSLFIKSSSYSSKIGEMSTFLLNFSEHKTDGAKINNLAALQLNLIKRCVISEMNVSTTGMIRARLYFKGRNFRGKKVSRFSPSAKFLYFAGINIHGEAILR